MAELIYTVSMGIALAAILLLLVRLVKGPGIADRAVALDTMTIVSVSLISYIALISARGIYLDVALVYGLVSFLGVVAVARFIEGGI